MSMNKKVLEVKNLLLDKGVENYNIQCKVERGMLFKFVYGKISHEIKDVFSLLVSLEKSGKISEFYVSGKYDIEKVNEIVDFCLKKTFIASKNKFVFEENFSKSQEFKAIYENFNYEDYVVWVEDELKLISKSVEFPFNFLYKIDVSKKSVLLNEKYYEVYDGKSNCFFVENISFKKSAFLNDYFYSRNLSDELMLKLNNY